MKYYAILAEYYNNSLRTHCIEAKSQKDAISILKSLNMGYRKILMINELDSESVAKEFV